MATFSFLLFNSVICKNQGRLCAFCLGLEVCNKAIKLNFLAKKNVTRFKEKTLYFPRLENAVII